MGWSRGLPDLSGRTGGKRGMGKEMTWKVGPSLWALVSGPLKEHEAPCVRGRAS